MDQAEFTTVLRLFGVEGDADALSLRLITEAKKGHSSQDKDAQAMTGRLLDQVGLPWDMDTAPPVMSNELNFPEFMYLVSSGLIEDNVDDWTEGSFHLRLFKSGYDIADVDGDGELTKQELSLAIGSVQSGSLTTEKSSIRSGTCSTQPKSRSFLLPNFWKEWSISKRPTMPFCVTSSHSPNPTN